MTAKEFTSHNMIGSWPLYKKVGFRIAFLFFLLLCIPLQLSWYKELIKIDWLHPDYRDIYDIARFETAVPNIMFHSMSSTEENDKIAAEISSNWITDYSPWGNALVIAVVAGLLWTVLDRRRSSYKALYYGLSVVVRFRAALGIICFGFTKVFPTQMPYPSYAMLNTDFGDFTLQKLYWLSIGIVPWYQVFGGLVEITAGLLLCFKKTATFGAILLIAALGDITFVNFAYNGSVHVYASYFVLLGLFVLMPDLLRLYKLLILEQHTIPQSFYPNYAEPLYKYGRLGLKSLSFLIFIVLLGYTQYLNFRYDPYKLPATAGVKGLRGTYTVKEFRINNQLIPYHPLDSLRWNQATFEQWNTLTFRVHKPVLIDPTNGGGAPIRDIQRRFEITGIAGGQHAFHYYADTIDHVLYLEDKNIFAGRMKADAKAVAQASQQHNSTTAKSWISDAAWKHIGDENKMVDGHVWSTRRDRVFSHPKGSTNVSKMILNYHTKDGSEIILNGINETNDSIYVVLERVNKKYVLEESSLKAGKY
jgi:hypothetical protein